MVRKRKTSEKATKVCKAPRCLNLFEVGEGTRRTDNLYCCNACRQRAHREGGPMVKGNKREAIYQEMLTVRREVGDLSDRLLSLGLRLEELQYTWGVASSEDWREALAEIEVFMEAQRNRQDFEGFDGLELITFTYGHIDEVTE